LMFFSMEPPPSGGRLAFTRAEARGYSLWQHSGSNPSLYFGPKPTLVLGCSRRLWPASYL
jgi:hypothetical protein